jgi:glucosylceramidase
VGQDNQEWQFRPTVSGYYNVFVRTASYLGWDVIGGAGATGNAAKVQLWTIGGTGGANQQWKPVSLGNNTYKFVARHSGRCLDVPGSSTANGVQLQQWDCNGTGAQAFRLVQQP